MLSKKQEKLIRSLNTKKGRQKNGLCLVDNLKVLDSLPESQILFTFNSKDTPLFDKLVTVETPRDKAAVVSIPRYQEADIQNNSTWIVLDGIQNPGNMGAIFRLALGFNATLILAESTDPSSPKVIRSSAGAFFQVPWIPKNRNEIGPWLTKQKRAIYRLESPKPNKKALLLNHKIELPKPLILIVGSEGQGILLKTKGTVLTIPHDKNLESLNVTHSLAIVLHHLYQT